jgi:hypothetical protein
MIIQSPKMLHNGPTGVTVWAVALSCLGDPYVFF